MRVRALFSAAMARAVGILAICGLLMLLGCRAPEGASETVYDGSPCTRHGDPASPLDPDGTQADVDATAATRLPPTGPFRSREIPFNVTNAPYGSARLLPENLVFSEGKYWVVTTDRGRSPNVISLLCSTDLVSWQYVGPILDDRIARDPRRDFDSPCLVWEGKTWYVVYSHYHGSFSTSAPAPIGIAHSESGRIDGPYVEDNARLLVPGLPGTWDGARVCEPYLLRRADGDWVLVYMGDAGGLTEQVGIAISQCGILGPYVKDPANPRIPFGPPDSMDAGTVADPWVIRSGDTYYIGYAASRTKHPPWVTTYATTRDWVTFVKSNRTILDPGPGDLAAFRGAVTLVGDQYLLPYCALGYRDHVMGYWFALASQTAVETSTATSVPARADLLRDATPRAWPGAGLAARPSPMPTMPTPSLR